MFVKLFEFVADRGHIRGGGFRLRDLLSGEDWVYLLSFLVPLFAYNVALKVVRISAQLDVPGPLGFLDQLRSDLFFNLGYAALWIGLFAAIRGGAGRTVLLALFHLSTLMVLVLSTSAHFFYETTGSSLDYNLVVLTFTSFEEIMTVVSSEVTGLHWVLISLILFYGIAGPAVITRLVKGVWHVPAGTPGPPSGARSSGVPWAAPLGMFMISGGLVLLSALPSLTGASNYFARDALVNMVLSEMETRSIEARVQTNIEPGDLPTDTRFVPTGKTEKRNVVLIFMESTRAESLTPYNKDLDTTPFLDELSRQSLMAERAYAVVPHTSKALVATVCGVAPPLDTKNTESEPDIIPARCLGDLLKEQGYRSAWFQSATENFERRRALVNNLGYDDFYPVNEMDKTGFQEVNYFGYEDNIMLEPSRKWLEENGKKGPFLASYLTVTPHHDYVVPTRYGTKRYVKDDLVNRYLNILHYEDRFVENLIRQYKDLGLYENTIFVILGDHGEGFGEHGLYQHDNTIYNEGLHIPLIIHDPKDGLKGRIEKPVDEMDVLPTVADLLGYDIRGGKYPGMSMLSPLPEDRILKASCYYEDRCLAAIEGDKKYIYHFGKEPDEFFDLSRDPDERNNIIDEQDRQKIEDLRYRLLEWQARTKAAYEMRRRPEETTGSD